MLEISLVVRGLVVGFAIAAPVGPIGVLCIRRTLALGWLWGFISGLGAATADAVYGCIAGFGITCVSNLLVEQQIWLRLGGSAFLCYLGLKTFMSMPAQQAAPVTANGLVGAYVSTFFLTLTNPVTILSFAAIFSGLGLAYLKQNYLCSLLLVSGVFVGSVFWWLLLSSGITLVRTKLTARNLRWVNRISGLVLIAFGLLTLLPS